jgi:peptidoglycan/LPS O-acetylase OafA/YrhL
VRITLDGADGVHVHDGGDVARELNRMSVAPSPLTPAPAPAPPTAQARPHLAFLDGVRGAAALFVVLHHAMASLPAGADDRVDHLLRILTHGGHFAVDLFIVLSGYCLMLPLSRSGVALETWTFIKRRALRILPTYFLAMVFSLVLIGTIIGQKTGTPWDFALPVRARDVELHLLLLHDWFPSSTFKINHPFWSIGVEWKIYFLFPVLLFLRRRWGTLATAGLATLGGYALWMVLARLHALNPSPYGSSVYYVGLFAMGMFAADAGEHPERYPVLSVGPYRLLLGALSLVVLFLAIEQGVSDDHFLRPQLASGVMGVWGALFLLALRRGFTPEWIKRIFAWRGSASVGKMGYSLYLIHAPILQVVYQYVLLPIRLHGHGRGPLMLAISTVATLGPAAVFYRVAERPFHRLSQARAG